MRTVFAFGVGLVMLCGLSGCGSSGPEGTTKELISTMNEMASTMEGIKDEASGEAAVPKLQKAAERGQELAKKMESYKLSPEQKKKLEETYKKEIEDVGKRLMSAMIQAGGKAPKAMQKIGEAMKKMKS